MKYRIGMMALFILPLFAPPPRVTICHVLSDPPSTMSVPEPAVDAHLKHGDYLGACVAPEPTPEPTPTEEPPARSRKIVIENMYYIEGWMWHGDVADPDFGASFYTYCILISDTHPSLEVQQAKCFPSLEWWPINAPCAGPVYEGDVWACDNELQARGWSRLPLAELCARYPSRCNR